MINKKRLIRLTQDLVRINSENPPGDELEIGKLVKKYLENLGIKVKVYEFKKNRSNIIAVLKGKSRNSLLITPHLDTVPAGRSWIELPFAGEIKNGKIYGLGSTDCKCNVAISLEVINSLIEDNQELPYDLIFAATADEESGSDLGLIPLLDKKILKPDVAVVLDADDFDIVVAQKGLMHIKIKIKGKKAHGAYPQRGTNAIDQAIDIIKEIKALRFEYKKNEYLKPPTINTGTINGGDKVNVVADWCEFELDFRFLPGMSAQNILKDVRKIIAKYTKKYKIEIEGIQAPYEIDRGHNLVRILKKTMEKFKIKSIIKGSEGATVITFFQAKGIPAIATGCGFGGGAHIADEYVKVDSVYKGALVLEEFLKNYNF